MNIGQIWTWISNPTNLGIIGSLASIIGLPIALLQLRDVRTKVKASQIAVDNLLNSMRYEKLNSIQERLNKQHDNFIRLKTRFGERGNSEKSENDSLTSIMLELNHCDHDLPTGVDSISDAIRKSVNNLEEMCKGKRDKTLIEETEDSIRVAIGMCKSEIEKGDKDLLSAVAKKSG